MPAPRPDACTSHRTGRALVGGRSGPAEEVGESRRRVAYTAGTPYAAFTGYREDDTRAYLYRTTDFGANWTSIVSNLPAESINVIREDPRNADVLYVGTDGGVYASLDRGMTWVSLGATLPTTPVHDLVVHPRDDEIVIGTHGRGVFVLDARPIQQWRAPAGAAGGPRLFAPHPAPVRRAD